MMRTNEGKDATSDHRERLRTVKEAISKGAAEMAWSTRFAYDGKWTA